MPSDAIELIAAAFQTARPPAVAVPAVNRELKCPVCAKVMRVERTEGVAIDACPSHGIWLDLGEMDQVVARIRSGQRVARWRAVQEAKREGKISGMFLGALSLLWQDE